MRTIESADAGRIPAAIHGAVARSCSLRLFGFILVLGSVLPLSAQVSVLTQHNNNARTGLNANETVLTRSNVNTNSFGKLFSQAVDGPVYAQPLYVPNVTVPNRGTHNVVYIATMHDSVYAFDADNNLGANAAPLWRVSFINPAAGITPVAVASGDAGPNCHTFDGEIGICGTPVIDASNGTLFVVARTKEPLPPPNDSISVQIQRLHALDIATGNERVNPVAIDGSVTGSGDGSSGGVIRFNPSRHVQRAGLLLLGGIVYVAFASYCDNDPYHGWIMGYQSQTLLPTGVFNDTPNGRHGGIWMAGAGLAADADGAIYCITGDGDFNTNTSPKDFGDSFLKLNQGTNLFVSDYFAPYDQANLYASDNDLGSGGAVVLPDSVGSPAHPHLLVGAGKDGKIYLLDRDNLGHFNPVNNSQIVQEVPFYSLQSGPPHLFGLPAFFNNRLYIQGVGEYLKAYTFTNGLLNSVPFSQNSDQVALRGSTPTISANGLSNGIVWEVASTFPPSANTTVRAFNADNLAQKLYDSYASMPVTSTDQMTQVKFVVPTVANGKVYACDTGSLVVFGLGSTIISITRDPVSGSVHLVWRHPTGSTSTVQASQDLTQWTDLGTGTATGPGTAEYTDTTAAGRQTRFYRLRQL